VSRDRGGMLLAMSPDVEISKLSGAACVKRLRELGFNVVRESSGVAVLKKGDRRVMIPDIESLEREMLEAILRSAGLSHAEFFRTRSGMYARTPESSRTRAKQGGDGSR
jgi:predicted RNA binding protein YcfA (HicA-like mRNA interferase family)